MPYPRIESILELGRWAPSGDNTQPWRFEIVSDDEVVVHGCDTRAHCVYDLDGHPTQIALGALIETLAIAASGHRLRTTAERLQGTPEDRPTFRLRFCSDAQMAPDVLIPCITTRSVQRRPLRTTPLSVSEKQALEAALAPAHRVHWLEGSATRWRVAKLMFDSARLRLTMPEAYAVHKSIIEWNVRFSDDRVPDRALGVDPLTARLMRFVMHSWERVHFFNRFLAGTWAPRLQMDLLPGIACAAHFVIEAKVPPATVDDYVDAGRAVQRFWLTATRLGLGLQPELTPLIFARYARTGRAFSATAGMAEGASAVGRRLGELLGAETAQRAAFMGRLGHGQPPSSRSRRLGLAKLLVKPGP